MTNLKRRRSPSSGCESTPTPISTSTTTASQPTYLGPAISGFDYPSAICPVPPPRKRAKMPHQNEYITSAGDAFPGYIPATTGPFINTTAGMHYPPAVSMAPSGSPFLHSHPVSSSSVAGTYTPAPVSTGPANPTYYPYTPMDSSQYPPQSGLEMGQIKNVKDLQRERRQAQNRQAQKEFRERKKREGEELIARVSRLEKDLEDANAEIDKISRENERLKRQMQGRHDGF